MMSLNFKAVLLFFMLSISFHATSQDVDQWCATTDGKVEWLQKYQANPVAYEKTNEVLFVPLTIHVVGTDEGTGLFGLERILKAFCVLNRDFEEANIRFFIEGDIRYIYNSSYATHNFGSGWQMMQEHNVSNTINCYIVEDPAGACGYAYYSAGIALKKTCIGPGDHTWAHEIGHYLSLPHTFYGWEGEIPETGSPAPNWIGGEQVEKVDGSNCQNAADGFCDTPPDYLSDRWPCNDQGLSGLEQMDPNGETFRSDGSFFMSYAFDDCSNRFSEEQIQAMRANLEDDRTNLLYNQTNVPHLPDVEVSLTSPEYEEVTDDPSQGITLSWEPVANATNYIVQLNPFPAFSLVYFEYNTSETSILVEGLEEDRNYYWRVKPYSAYSSCVPFSDTWKFRTGMMTTDTNELAENGPDLMVYPNPAKQAQNLTIEYFLQETEEIEITLFNGTGKEVFLANIPGRKGNNTLNLSTNQLPSGVYYLSLVNQNGKHIEKVVIQ